MGVPISYWGGQSSSPRIYNIEVELDTVDELTVSIAPLLYNKEKVFTIEIDDMLNDLYVTIYKLFNGGVTEKEPAYTSPGMFITDGCGNNVPFKAASTAFVKRYNPNPPFLDWFQYYTSWDGSGLTYPQMDELMANGYGICDHGFWSDMQNAPDVRQSVRDFIDWSETRYKFRPLSIIAPGGVTFDYAAWKDEWYQNGCRFSTYASGTGTDTVRVDNINAMTMTEPIEIGRWSLEQRSLEDFKAKIDTLMALPNVQFLRTFGHLIEASSFINYQAFKDAMLYIEETYGKNGSDNLWVASITDLVSYLFVRDSLVVNKLVDGNKHLITLDVSGIPAYVTKRFTTLLLSSTSNIVDVKINGYKGSNNMEMVNIEL